MWSAMPVTAATTCGSAARTASGTAQKLVLNMISTIVMVRLGKTYGNLMVDVRPTNHKLRERAVRIVGQVTGADAAAARAALTAAGWDVKVAAVVLRLGIDPDAAGERLAAAGGRLREAFGEA